MMMSSGASGASSSAAPGEKEITQDDLWEELEKQSASKKEGEPHVQRNINEESSLHNRIRALGNKEGGSLFLLDKEPSEYWGFVKEILGTASYQWEYATLLETESRDLLIRENYVFLFYFLCSPKIHFYLTGVSNAIPILPFYRFLTIRGLSWKNN
jgi:hypothetical protein